MDDEAWLESDVKVYESRGEEHAYATLSHCWGGHEFVRLLTGNISAFQNQVPWSALTKTFQHAIKFARMLNLRYIWIDSLCIVQDCKQDWLEQSSKMASIYEHSAVTLAATVALNGTAGCFMQPTEILSGYVTDGKIQIPVADEESVKNLIQRSPKASRSLFVECQNTMSLIASEKITCL